MAEQSTERRGRLAPLLAWTGGLVVLVAALALLATNCGPTPLEKAFPDYDSKVEKLLDDDLAVWKRLLALYNEQIQSGGAGHAKFESYVKKDAIPTYDKLVADVAAIQPAEPELQKAHEILVKHAAARAAFAHLLAQNLDVFSPEAAGDELGRKTSAAEYAVQDYDKWTHDDQTRVADARFTELRGLRNDFANRFEKFQGHKIARAELDDFIRKEAIPKVKKLRAGRFDEDEPSRLLREAIATTEEYYAVLADSLPMIERQLTFAEESDRLSKEGDDLLKRFRDELKQIRNKL